MRKTLVRTTFLGNKEKENKKEVRRYVLEITIFGYIDGTRLNMLLGLCDINIWSRHYV